MAESFLHGITMTEVTDGVRPVQLASTSVIGVVGTAPEADESEFPMNTPKLLVGNRRKAAELGSSGTLRDAVDDIFNVIGAAVVVVRVEEGEDEEATLSNVVGGVDSETGQYLGVEALLSAQGTVGSKPRILCAPGWTHQRPEDPDNTGEHLANPVGAALKSVAEKLRAIVAIDGPNSSDEEALAAREDYGTRRVFLHDPWYQYWDTEAEDAVTRPSSGTIAGLIAWNDNRNGWHTSPSNILVPNIVGLGRDIDYAPGGGGRANHLNSNEIATTIRDSGFRLWGNRTTSEDPKWAFLAHVRIADIINDSLEAAHRWAVDRNLTQTYYEDVTGSVNAFLKGLAADDRIAGGSAWVDPDLNTEEDMLNGRAVFDFDFSPYGVAEGITFRSQMTNGYLEGILDE